MTDVLPVEFRELLRLAVAEQAVRSSSPWLLTGEDSIRLRVFNSAASVRVTVEGRVLRFDGNVHPFAIELTPTTDRLESTVTGIIGDGFLLNFSVRASAGTPRIGQCYATVELVRGTSGAAAILGALVSGYVTDTQRMAWPGSPMRSSIEGPGVVRSITGTDPAAGAEISETVPTNARWLIHSFYAQLVTDATVGNRAATLILDDGATSLWRIPTGSNQTASQTVTYVGHNYGVSQATSAILLFPWQAPGLVAMGGFRLRTTTGGIIAGDNWGAPQLTVEEWIED